MLYFGGTKFIWHRYAGTCMLPLPGRMSCCGENEYKSSNFYFWLKIAYTVINTSSAIYSGINYCFDAFNPHSRPLVGNGRSSGPLSSCRCLTGEHGANIAGPARRETYFVLVTYSNVM